MRHVKDIISLVRNPSMEILRFLLALVGGLLCGLAIGVYLCNRDGSVMFINGMLFVVASCLTGRINIR